MKHRILHSIITYFIAAVWLINGLYCKVLSGVPRHEEIVAAILGSANSRWLTILIGLSEVMMAIWILSKIKSRLNALVQILIVGTMNIIEFIVVPELLMWGKMNIAFALLFIMIVYWNEFRLKNSIE